MKVAASERGRWNVRIREMNTGENENEGFDVMF
jgi:hypothetical protein